VADRAHVRGGGYIVAMDGKVRLCGRNIVHDAGFPEGSVSQCPRGVDLVGFDTSMLKAVSGGRAGNGSFEGTWHNDSVAIRSSSSQEQDDRGSGGVLDDAVVPCPKPVGGWPANALPQEDYPAPLLEHRKTYPTMP
jgi:hypothetical protein